MKRYNPSEIEPKWQAQWAADGRYKAPDASNKPKYYVTGMFPYPSGAGMHTGHFFEHSIVDAVARFRRALGYNVMYPMGFDSFGLPAENYAIKTGKTPQETTATNIASFKNQLNRVGASIDWSREVNTADPHYYKWTQWIFTQLYERDLAYQKEAMQWWCPKDKTVLANEQVVDGKCWRCESVVEKKAMKQWFFKITNYADALLEELPGLNWPNKIKLAQQNWIGRSVGAEVEFALANSQEGQTKDSLKFTPILTEMILSGEKTSTIRLEQKNLRVGDIAEFMTRDGKKVTPFGYAKITNIRTMPLRDIPNDLEGHEPMASDEQKLAKYKGYYGNSVTLDTDFTIYDFDFSLTPYSTPHTPSSKAITVFTTRPDTLFGATFLVLAPENPLVGQLVNEQTKDAVQSYIDQAVKKSEIERQSEGKEKTGVFTGSYAINPATGAKIPIWVADYVLWGYGTGAVMGVPGHDERDFAFATRFKLPIERVIVQDFGTVLPEPVNVTGPVVIGYDPRTKEFMSLLNKNVSNMRWFVAGGLNEGETYEQAALRELKEEAGFDECEQLIQLGEPTNSYYFNPNKKSNRRSYSFMYVAILDKTKQGMQAQEANENYEVTWGSADEIENELIVAQKETGGRGHWVDGIQRAREAVRAYEAGGAYQPGIYHGEGTLINSGAFDGMSSAEAREQIVAWLEQQGVGQLKVTYKMRDWLISRQRYWGAPIPIIHCPSCGVVPVPKEDLPVLLPDIEDFAPRGDGKSALAAQEDWVNVACPACGGAALRETDTMDGYACSSWYLLRYTDPTDSNMAWDPQLANHWAPLDMYIGGDHAVAHLLYVRFWTHVFKDMGLVDFKEPVKELVYHGLIQAEDGRKMSKSLGNVVDPLEVIDQGYGADALRTFELFLGPINENSSWSSRGITGVYRFINRVWTLVQEYSEAPKGSASDDTSGELLSLTHTTIKKVTDDIERLSFNTAIAALMEFTNELYKLKTSGFSADWQFTIETLIKLLQPMAPHVAAELWEQLGHSGQLDFVAWPQWDEQKIIKDTMTIIVQVNGKLRASLQVPSTATEDDVIATAQQDVNVQRHIEGRQVLKQIYVPGKILNLVVK